MKKRLAKYNQVKFFLKDRSQIARLGANPEQRHCLRAG